MFKKKYDPIGASNPPTQRKPMRSPGANIPVRKPADAAPEAPHVRGGNKPTPSERKARIEAKRQARRQMMAARRPRNSRRRMVR